MKAKVVMIKSGADFADKQRRVRVRFDDAEYGWRELEFPEAMLGLREGTVTLDMVLGVEVEPVDEFLKVVPLYEKHSD